MALELWTSTDLMQLRADPRLEPLPSFFLDTFFTDTHYSSDAEIKFADLPTPYRRLAPFVLPTEQGKPIFARKGESVRALTPPYIKPKDAVRPEDARNVLPSEVWRNGGQRPSLAARFEQRVAEVAKFHIRAIRMQELWMAARAMIDAKISVKYDRDQGVAFPEVLIDFGRAPGHNVTKGANYWNDPATDILGDLESWMGTMYAAPFGGSANMLIVGSAVAGTFAKNNGIRVMLDKNVRGNESVEIKLGIMRNDEPLQYIGKLDDGLTVWKYKDMVEGPDGTMVDIMDPRDILLVAPGASGVRAYGAIYNTKAIAEGSISIDVFPSMWVQDDPGVHYLMHESSPLPIPLYPDRTFKARVLP